MITKSAPSSISSRPNLVEHYIHPGPQRTVEECHHSSPETACGAGAWYVVDVRPDIALNDIRKVLQCRVQLLHQFRRCSLLRARKLPMHPPAP